jgi:hypothetical protein
MHDVIVVNNCSCTHYQSRSCHKMIAVLAVARAYVANTTFFESALHCSNVYVCDSGTNQCTCIAIYYQSQTTECARGVQ